jgi:hypothetical protein
MAEQRRRFRGKPQENYGLSLASDTAAYAGLVLVSETDSEPNSREISYSGRVLGKRV